jgi:hypothetical protein
MEATDPEAIIWRLALGVAVGIVLAIWYLSTLSAPTEVVTGETSIHLSEPAQP